jgi:hypothetical protein
MKETLTINGRGYDVTVTISVDGDRAKFLADAEKLRDSLVAAFDQAIDAEKSKQ